MMFYVKSYTGVVTTKMRECEVKSANRVLGPQDRVSPQQTASPISISERANVATQN